MPVNLLTSCMLHELQGLGGGVLTSLPTCSHLVCFVNFGFVYIYIYSRNVYIYTHTCIDLLSDMYTYIYIYKYVQMYLHLHTFTYIHTYRQTDIHTYIYIYRRFFLVGECHSLTEKKPLTPLQFLKQLAKTCNAP